MSYHRCCIGELKIIVMYDQEIVKTPTNALEVTPMLFQQQHLRVASDVEQRTCGYEN